VTAADEDKILDRIRALLAKAESTNFGPEAEAFVAKAHELMAKYAIDYAVLQAKSGKIEDIVIIKIKASRDSTSQPGRAGLLNAVTKTSRCRTIITGDFLTVMGFKSDVAYVEMMYTSLVTQMLGGLFDARDEVKGRKTAGFDMSFCDAYSSRIYVRLQEISDRTEREAGAEAGIVLYDRSKKVDDAVRDEFPNLSKAPMRRYNVDARGVRMGREAADNADLGQKRTGAGGRKEIA